MDLTQGCFRLLHCNECNITVETVSFERLTGVLALAVDPGGGVVVLCIFIVPVLNGVRRAGVTCGG